MELVSLRSPQVRDAVAQGIIAVIPIGSVEQHSNHLPVGTDALIASAVAARIEQSRADRVLLCPTVWYGASDHHLGFPGTVTVGTDTLVSTLTGIALSLHQSSGIRHTFFVNGHGGNRPGLSLTAERIAAAGGQPRMWGLSYWDAMNAQLAAQGADPVTVRHACHVETSILLALGQSGVDMSLAEIDDARPDFPEWLAASSRFPARTGHGGVGDPTNATAAAGEEFLAAAVRGITTLIDRIGTEWADVPG